MNPPTPLSPAVIGSLSVAGADAQDASHTEAIVGVFRAVPGILVRSQFFIWTQGQMQKLLPHQVLVCGCYEPEQGRLIFSVFNSIALPAEAAHCLCDESGPFLRAIMDEWVRARGRPLVIDIATMGEPARRAAHTLLTDAGIFRLVVHGCARPQRPHELESLFLFGEPGIERLEQMQSGAELLLPSLHSAWRTVLSARHERPSHGAPSGAPATGLEASASLGDGLAVLKPPLTPREVQILQCVRAGGSNREIALALSLSPLTVKNHLQKILRKLGVGTRTQAVTNAAALGLLSPADPPAALSFPAQS
jgi:transcriptional regulator EpsA